jgi:hypothetical protein
MSVGLDVYIWGILGMSIAFLLLANITGTSGYGTIATQIQQCSTEGICLLGNNFGEALMNGIIKFVTNPAFLIPLAATAFVSFLIGGSFGLIYIIPILLLSLILNIFIIPTGFFVNDLGVLGLPPFIKFVLAAFWNVFLMLAILGFIRG